MLRGVADHADLVRRIAEIVDESDSATDTVDKPDSFSSVRVTT